MEVSHEPEPGDTRRSIHCPTLAPILHMITANTAVGNKYHDNKLFMVIVDFNVELYLFFVREIYNDFLLPKTKTLTAQAILKFFILVNISKS